MVIKMSSAASWKQLPIFLGVCFAVFLFGGLFQPGDWYRTLTIPPWTPPNIVFPIVWSFLYLCIAFAGWLIFASDKKALKVLWVVQLVLNGLWSWIFFGEHWIILGAIEIVFIDIVVIVLIVGAFAGGRVFSGARALSGETALSDKTAMSKQNGKLKVAALLLSPYLAWLLLATSLNIYIAIAN